MVSYVKQHVHGLLSIKICLMTCNKFRVFSILYDERGLFIFLCIP